MKTAELKDELLDYWVGKALGLPVFIHDCISGRACSVKDEHTWSGSRNFSPSTDWAIGGPIIEREKITVEPNPYDEKREWAACVGRNDKEQILIWALGESYLIAGMRAYVASKFGEEVDTIPQKDSL